MLIIVCYGFNTDEYDRSSMPTLSTDTMHELVDSYDKQRAAYNPWMMLDNFYLLSPEPLELGSATGPVNAAARVKRLPRVARRHILQWRWIWWRSSPGVCKPMYR